MVLITCPMVTSVVVVVVGSASSIWADMTFPIFMLNRTWFGPLALSIILNTNASPFIGVGSGTNALFSSYVSINLKLPRNEEVAMTLVVVVAVIRSVMRNENRFFILFVTFMTVELTARNRAS